jgi:hypothetical protein
MKREIAVITVRPKTPTATPRPIDAVEESLYWVCCAWTVAVDEEGGYDKVDVGVIDRVLVEVDKVGDIGTVLTDTIVSMAVVIDFAMVEEGVDVVVDRFKSGTCTVENAGSLIFSNLTKEKAWPS